MASLNKDRIRGLEWKVAGLESRLGEQEEMFKDIMKLMRNKNTFLSFKFNDEEPKKSEDLGAMRRMEALSSREYRLRDNG